MLAFGNALAEFKTKNSTQNIAPLALQVMALKSMVQSFTAQVVYFAHGHPNPRKKC